MVMQRHKSLEVIDDLNPGRSRAPAIGVTGKAQSMYALDMSDDDDEDEEDDDDEVEEGEGSRPSTGGGGDLNGAELPAMIDDTPVGREKVGSCLHAYYMSYSGHVVGTVSTVGKSHLGQGTDPVVGLHVSVCVEKEIRGGMQKLGLGGTAGNSPRFQHGYEENRVRLLVIPL
jgi:hypothetical protein